MFLEAIDERVKSLLFGTLPPILKGLENFYLAGGTGLALLLGHRKSVDVDLFREKEFDVERLSFDLSRTGAEISVAEQGTLHAFVEGIKLSFLHYPYPLLKDPQVIEGVRVACIEDIACMKVIAVSQRAEKKDFFDLYELLQKFGPAQLGKMIIEKYGKERVNAYHTLKSFFYFADAEGSLDPVSLHDVTWEKVKQYLRENEQIITETFWNL